MHAKTKHRFPRLLRFITAPVTGGAPVEPDPTNKDATVTPTPPEAPQAPKPEERLGDTGIKALHEERSARKAAEKAARDTQTALDAERNAHAATRQEADGEKLANLKMTVALAEGVPAQLASRLVGSTRDELTADAKTIRGSLTASFVAPIDPSQGMGRGGGSGGGVEAGKDLYQRLHSKKSR